ncbi:GerAB/ArcD/ProY family transporter [Lysinibacillus sp. 3P01SB]|uniref:GerAB/ArcD/ProY family transporter n=1 Tax=Lysinibacillus sp. 3P01SB TaxID=3132284 RepID=UPI0039A6C4B3
MNPKHQINAFLIVAIISANQVGVGVMGFQQQLYQHAKQDAWISVIISFLLAHLVIFIMIKTLEIYQTNDIYEINQDIFGKFIGNFLNVLYITYCGSIFFVILKTYIEVINTWVFYNLSPWFLSATLLLLLIYTFTGTLKVIVGVSFFSFVITYVWLFSLIPPLEYAEVNYLLPVLESSIVDILKGTYSMTFTIVGFEILNIVYPYIKDKKKVNRYAHLGLLGTLIMYFPILLVSLMYFSGEQLSKTVWPTLTMLSIVRLPFIERIDIFMICFGVVIILPNLCLYAWAVYRGVNSIIKISLSAFIWAFSGLMFILSCLVQTMTQLNDISAIFTHVGFFTVFVFPFFLYFLALIKRKFRKTQVTQ